MSAIHPFLNSITEVNASYIDRLYDDARSLITQATNDINNISTSLPALDFTGITPSLIDPTAYGIGTMPTAPINPATATEVVTPAAIAHAATGTAMNGIIRSPYILKFRK